MKSKHKIVILLICILIIPLNLSMSLTNQNQEIIEKPKTSGTISYSIIRPLEDLMNSGFTSEPSSGYLYTKINENINYSTTDGDTTYIEGGDDDECEFYMSDISPIQSNQKIISITLYARGATSGPSDPHSFDFDWRIGSGSYSSERNIEFTTYSFEWQIASSWTNLDLTHFDINSLSLRIDTLGYFLDRFQLLSILYLNLTIETNHNPIVNVDSPNGGEIVQNSTLIEWTYSDSDGDMISFDVYYAIGFEPWRVIVLDLVNQDYYNWTFEKFNITATNVRVRVDANDGNGGFDSDESDDYFTVRVNLKPDINITTPNGGELLIDSINLEWDCYDGNSDDLTFNLYYRISMGNWLNIQLGLVNTYTYLWNLSQFTETFTNVELKINVTDEWGGYDEDISDDYFTIKYNQIPEINITYPIGGEVLRNQVIISWNYSEPDGDTMRFNISYLVSGGDWIIIVQNLVNSTSYEWDINSFNERFENVLIKIEGMDDFGAKVEVICQSNFTIVPVSSAPSPFELFMKIFPFLLIGSSITILVGTGIYIQKKKKKRNINQKIVKINNKYIDKSENGTKKVIIEADLLVKRGKNYSKDDLLSLLFSDKEISNNNDYESIKILGKLNITTLSEDFWEKIEKFKWEDDDKEAFINDMLALPPSCRDQFLNEMTEKFQVND